MDPPWAREVSHEFDRKYHPQCNVLINNAALVHRSNFFSDSEIIDKAELETQTNFIAPAMGDSFLVRADVLKPGRTLTVYAAKSIAVSEYKERLIASMIGTLMAIRDRRGVSQESPLLTRGQAGLKCS